MAKRDLVGLLVRLYADPELERRVKRDPRGVAKRAGLSAREQALLAGGDGAAMRKYLGSESVKSIIIQAPSIIIRSAIETSRDPNARGRVGRA